MAWPDGLDLLPLVAEVVRDAGPLAPEDVGLDGDIARPARASRPPMKLGEFGLYWAEDENHWAERWWAPSRLWREKLCYLGWHWWMASGTGGSHDYWRVGYRWREPTEGLRWCSRCAKRRGFLRLTRPASIWPTWCPRCGITDVALANGHAHLSWCAVPGPGP